MSTNDDMLEEQHHRYLQEVTDSGLPLWMAEMYGYNPCHIPETVVDDDIPVIRTQVQDKNEENSTLNKK